MTEDSPVDGNKARASGASKDENSPKKKEAMVSASRKTGKAKR
jgi:hypothetical protein